MAQGTAATTLGLVEGQVYEVAVFQAERMADASTFKIALPGFSTAPACAGETSTNASAADFGSRLD